MLSHPLLDQLDAALAEILPSSEIGLHGQWSSLLRRSYRGQSQSGSGSGPYVEVFDDVWDGRLTATAAFTGIAFLRTDTCVYWAKAAHASAELAVRVSLTGNADPARASRTFCVGLDDIVLPAVPVRLETRQPSECVLATDVVPTARVTCIARCAETAFFVVVLPTNAVTFGRNRLWRLRESFAARLPDDVRALLTRRRSGVARVQASG